MNASNEKRGVETIVNGAIVREAYPKNWYVAQVQMKCEKKTAQKLSALGYETFVPVQSEIHQWSDRRKKVEKIVIPLVVFVRSDEETVKEIEKLSFVYRLLRAPGDCKPAKIPCEQMDQFKFLLGNCDSEITLESLEIKKGDRVRIVRGNLKGLEGFITGISDSKSKVSIVIDYIGCASIKIDKTDLVLVKE